MEIHKGASAKPAIANTMPFTLSPDAVFPPHSSSSDSSLADSPLTPILRSLTLTNEIEDLDFCRAYSIEFCFPPADSGACSDGVVLSDSASSSPAVWKETLQLDRIDKVLAVGGEHNHLPVIGFQGMSTRWKQGAQSSRMNSLGGRARIISFQKALEIVDAVGSTLSNLNYGNRFFSSLSLKGNKASILAFEIANTVIKVATLLKSLSEENLNFFEREALFSTGVRTLVSNDSEELLRIYASDKREELDHLLGKLVIFGNRCKDPQWHHLDIYFSRLELGNSPYKMPRDEAELTMHQLVILAQYTLELYYSLLDLEKLEKDYMQKFQEILEALNPSQRGELKLLQSELKEQRKHVRNLKNKSFWSRNLEEIMESLVDVVTYIHQSVMEVFGKNASRGTCKNLNGGLETLGKDGLALRYANIVQQIDYIAYDLSAVSPEARDSLYHSLPVSVKMALRFRLRSLSAEKEQLSASEIKAEINKTLEWLVPLATNTSIALQTFGWVREWANTRIKFDMSKAANYNSLSRFQTLYHANKQKMEGCILELIIWLHRLISSSRKQNDPSKIFPWETESSMVLDNRLISKTKTQVSPSPGSDGNDPKPGFAEVMSALNRLSSEQQIILRSKSTPGASKSNESVSQHKTKGKTFWGLSRSVGSPAGRPLGDRVAIEHKNGSILDVMDGLDFA